MSVVVGGEVPVGVRSNLVPAEIVVVSNLAEDTVIANPMDVASGSNKQAMFANPFAGGSEEILYVDHAGHLWWARHLRPDGDSGQAAGDRVGWTQQQLATAVSEVVVAVHPSGDVFAFTLVGSGNQVELHSFQLLADPSVPGGQRWALDKWLVAEPYEGLQVYYCTDRPATPFVFVRSRKSFVSGKPRLIWFSPRYSADGSTQMLWHQGGEFDHDPADLDQPMVAGVDSPLELGSVPAVSVVRLWSLVGDQLYLTSHYPANGPGYNRWRVPTAEPWSRLVGAWAHPAGAGVVGSTSRAVLFALPLAAEAEELVPARVVLDRVLEDLVVWQDSDTFLHVYGRDQSAALCAVHQTGWSNGDFYGRAVPVWDSHPVPPPDTGLVGTTRPLVGQVATFAVDAFPDFMPNQHVMHQAMSPGEACAMYTQDVRTGFWATEKMRMVPAPAALPTPYTVPRYQTSLTVKNAFGTPIAGVGVQVTADDPVDLEVAGRFYRTGSVAPITLTTDLRGQVTLRVVATGLTMPNLYVTVPGLEESLTVQPAAEVHKFLAGNTTLPNHPRGFSAEVVQDATIPGTQSKLFPELAPPDSPDTWPPKAAEVVTWCHGAFAVQTKTPLPRPMTQELAQGERVLAFTLQTHDPTRPGFEVYSHPDQLAARAASIKAVGGFLTEADDWLGDIWQGIRQGVTDVTEVMLDLQGETIEMAIRLADGALNFVKLAWNDPVTAAHAIEAAFVAIGATIQDTLHWLQWAFDFKDAFLTAQALTQAVTQIPDLLAPKLEEWQHLADDFFTHALKDVEKWFSDAKSGLTGQTVANIQSPAAPPPRTALPTDAATAAEQGRGPHCNWLMDQVTGVGAVTGAPALPAPLGSLFDELWAALDVSPAAFEHLAKAWDDVRELLANLFDGEDAQTIVSRELVVLLDLVQQVVEAVLQYASDVVAGVIGWAVGALTTYADVLKTPLDGVPLVATLWDFMLGRAGLDPVKHPLTVGALALLVGAYPTTILYKMVMGAAPFPDGKLPDVPTAGTSHLAGDDARSLLGVQVFTGLYRLTDLAFYPVLDVMALNPLRPDEPNRPWMPRPAPFLYSAATTVNRLVLYGVFSYPGWYAKGLQPGSVYPGTWITYATRALWTVADVIVVATEGSPMERLKVDHPDLRTWRLPMVCAALGLVTLVSPWPRLAQPDHRTWFDVRLAMLDSLPSFPWIFGLFRHYDWMRIENLALGVIADGLVGAGVTTYRAVQEVAQTAYQLNHPPTIATGSGPVDLGTVSVGQSFTSQAIEVVGGFPAYSWSLATAIGQTGPPPGSWKFQDRSPDKDYPGRRVQLSCDRVAGEPGQTYTFTLRVEDNFPGPGTSEHACQIRVVEG